MLVRFTWDWWSSTSAFICAVLGLQTMRGVQFTAAVGRLTELDDLSRFTHPRQFNGMAVACHIARDISRLTRRSPINLTMEEAFPKGGVARHTSHPRGRYVTNCIRLAALDSGRLIGWTSVMQ